MKNFTELDLPTYSNKPLIDLNDLLSSKKISWGNCNQICLNTLPEHKDNIELGTGSLALDWENSNFKSINDITEINIPVIKDRLHESDFTVLCDQFKGTVFETIYDMLTQRYVLGRVRLMKSEPHTCLSWHNDTTPRLHYPILTYPGCLMVIDDEVIHLKYGKWWLTETRKKHTALNGSRYSRIHLVAVILETR